MSENLDFFFLSGKYPDHFQIRECIHNTIEESVPVYIRESLIVVRRIPEIPDTDDCKWKKKESNKSHLDINVETRDNQNNAHEQLRNNMEHTIVAHIPDGFTRSVNDFLFLSMLETDMIIYRKP